MCLGCVHVGLADIPAQCHAGSTSSDCRCPADRYRRAVVLNPAETARSYSSEMGIPENLFLSSMLDTFSGTRAWSPSSSTNGEWMEMDAGQGSYIAGVLTQGREDDPGYAQWVSEFRIEYRGDSGGNTLIGGTFRTSDANKKLHTFASVVFARYIRIVALKTDNRMALRAAVVAMMCSECADNTFAAANSSSLDACVCAPNHQRRINAVSKRSVSLAPLSVHFSTADRRDSLTTSSSAVWNSNAGPSGSRGAVTFDNTKWQWVSGPAHNFLVSQHGGFTAVAVLKFEKVLTGGEQFGTRIFEFYNMDKRNYITLAKYPGHTLRFDWVVGNVFFCSFGSGRQDFVYDTWFAVALRYDHITNDIELMVNSIVIASRKCFSANVNLDMGVTRMSIGASQIFNFQFLRGSIAGLLAVDAALSAQHIFEITANMYAGVDTQVSCVPDCPRNALYSDDGVTCVCKAGFEASAETTSFQGSTGAITCLIVCPSHLVRTLDGLACTCDAGLEMSADSESNRTCTACPVGTFKSSPGFSPCTKFSAGRYFSQIITPSTGKIDDSITCPTGSDSPEGSIGIRSCTCNKGHTGEDGAACLMCAPGKYKESQGPALCLPCPATRFSEAAAVNVSQCLCRPGFSGGLSVDAGQCVACAINSSKSQPGDAACVPCAGGTHAPLAGSTRCFSLVCL